MEINQALVQQMRTDFASGVEPCEIVERVHEALGGRKVSAVLVIFYFTQAFDLRIKEASLIASWEGLKTDYERGTSTSQEINNQIRPLIEARAMTWREQK